MFRRTALLASALLAAPAAAHMPAGSGDGSMNEPTDLGDITKNSWALTGELKPKEVRYYKFTIDGPTPADQVGVEGAKHRFYTGLYVPGAGEPGFTFYVAVFGLSNATECERWGDGWGRRRQLLDGWEWTPPTGPDRITSAGTTWIMDSSHLPESVVGPHAATPHSHGGGFDYHLPEETLVFIASPSTDLPNKFESFSPTLFKPRGSCITDFPRGGEYRIAVWGAPDQVGAKKFSVGLGLAERDVFAPMNLIKFDYILWDVQTWNGWSGFVLLLPMIVLVLAAGLVLALLKKHRPAHYGTESGMATPFRAMVLLCSAILLGHLLMNIAILVWAASNAHVEQARELMFPVMMTIALPLVSSSFTLAIGLNLPACCCCGQRTAAASPCYRVTVGLFGFLHLFIHCGYIVGPVLLLLTSVLPPSMANRGLVDTATGKKGKAAMVASSTASSGSAAVQTTPGTADAL